MLAILVFFKKEVSEPEPRVIELVNTIATQLGSLIGRKRSESALRESQQQFAAMSANIPGAVYRGVVHLDGKISCLYVSEGIREITGLDPETLRLDPQHYLQMIHPQDKIDFNAALQASIQSLQPNSYEYRIITPSGKVKSVRDSLRCSRMDNGDVIVDGVMLDISDRVAAQERLQLLDRAIGASSNGIVITDPTQPDNPVIYLNPGFERITGYSPGEILGKNCRFLQGSETTQPALNELRTALKEEKHCHVILRNYRKDGTLFWNEFSISPVRDSSGNLTHYIGVQTDITELKQAEEALRESEARFARLAENVPGVIYQYRLYPDGTDEFTYVSAAIRDLFELEPEAVQQDSGLMWASIHPDDLSAFIASLNHSAQTLGQWSWEWRNITSSGTLTWLRGVAKPQRQADGTLIWDGILLDISDRKQAESALQNLSEQQREKAQQLEQTLIELQRTQARLVQNEKMASLGQLVAGVAHEINNPVSFISCNISPAFEYAHNLLYLLRLYQQHYPDPVTEIAQQLEHLELEFIAEDFPKLLESMQEGANRIAEIVLSLRNFSRLDQSERKLADIHQGIDNTLLILQHRLKQHAKETEIQLIKNYSELPLIECYPGQLNQVFMNIISNAIDAIEESLLMGHLSLTKNTGKIQISTQVLKPNWIAIHISDNGSGLTPEMRSRIFDPFFTTKPPGKGTGLGLSISYRIIAERHGGHLLCHSVPNQGTEFVIELPIHQDQE